MQETKDPIILLNIVVRILPWWHHGVFTKYLGNYLLLLAIMPIFLLMFWYSNVRITSLFYNSAWSYFALNFKKYTNLVPRKKYELNLLVCLYCILILVTRYFLLNTWYAFRSDCRIMSLESSAASSIPLYKEAIF